MKRQFKDFLEDILDEVKIIHLALDGVDFQNFKSNIVLVRAVMKSLEIIGEAVSHVPEEVRIKYSYVEWRRIKGFRDVVTHKYWAIDLHYVWDIIENKLEILKEQIEEIMKKEDLL